MAGRHWPTDKWEIERLIVVLRKLLVITFHWLKASLLQQIVRGDFITFWRFNEIQQPDVLKVIVFIVNILKRGLIVLTFSSQSNNTGGSSSNTFRDCDLDRCALFFFAGPTCSSILLSKMTVSASFRAFMKYCWAKISKPEHDKTMWMWILVFILTNEWGQSNCGLGLNFTVSTQRQVFKLV